MNNLQSLKIEVSRQRDCSKPLQPYKADCIIQENSFTIASNCVREKINVLSDEKEVVLFHTKANYWNALHHKMEQLFSQASRGITHITVNGDNLPENVRLGLKLLEALLAKDIEIPSSMVIPTELTFEIINRFSYPALPTNLYKIIAICISISSKLVFQFKNLVTRVVDQNIE